MFKKAEIEILELDIDIITTSPNIDGGFEGIPDITDGNEQ